MWLLPVPVYVPSAIITVSLSAIPSTPFCIVWNGLSALPSPLISSPVVLTCIFTAETALINVNEAMIKIIGMRIFLVVRFLIFSPPKKFIF
ncbi:MAG: hypothetical protein HZC47_05345 [Methanobacterium sp.]|uniref:hypothetical protein n=1 Tax=Methanobacterium sp. TaxID=2164 RepID=UPI003D64C107|nr:hypothetical protein [Methanobacterium sp.]